MPREVFELLFQTHNFISEIRHALPKSFRQQSKK